MGNSVMVDQRGRLKIPVTLLPAVKGSGTEFLHHLRRWLLVLRSSAHMKGGVDKGRKRT